MKKITKIMLSLLLVVVAFAGVIGFSGCELGNKTAITNIGLTKEIQKEYFLNEKLELNDAKLIVTLADLTQKELIITNDMITGFDSSTSGEKTLVITFQGKQVEVQYSVRETESFETIMGKAVSNLIDAEKFIADCESYIVSGDKAVYTKNNGYLKVEFEGAAFSEGSGDVIYDLVNGKQVDETGNVTYTSLTQRQMYSYSIALLFASDGATLTEVETKFENGKYVVNYEFEKEMYGVQGNPGSTTVVYNLTATLSRDCKIESLIGDGFIKITYEYDDVPTVDWPTNA